MSWPLSHVGRKCPQLPGIQGSWSESGAAVAGPLGPPAPSLRGGGAGLVALGGRGLTWTPPSTFPLLHKPLGVGCGCQVCLRLPSPCSLDESCDKGYSAEEQRWGWPWRAMCGSCRRALGCSPISWSVLGHFLITECPGSQTSLKPPGYFIKMQVPAPPLRLNFWEQGSRNLHFNAPHTYPIPHQVILMRVAHGPLLGPR